MSFKIEKNVPMIGVAQKHWKLGRKKLDATYYALHKMEIGDSILFEETYKANQFIQRSNVWTLSGYWLRRFKRVFVKDGVRVFRVEDFKEKPTRSISLID